MILRSLLCSSALLIAAPAMAQDMQAQPQTTAPTPDPQVTPEAATPAAPATATPQAPAAPASPDSSTTTAQTAPADTAQPAQGQAASGAQIAAIVNSEFPTYDADKSGDLSETEFAAWMTALKKQESAATGQPLDPAAVDTWAKGAFATADKDQSKLVSKEELTTYLGG